MERDMREQKDENAEKIELAWSCTNLLRAITKKEQL